MQVRLNDESKMKVTVEKGLFSFGKREKKEIIKYRIELLILEDGIQLIKTNYDDEHDIISTHVRYDQVNRIQYDQDMLRIRFTNTMNESDDFEVSLKDVSSAELIVKRIHDYCGLDTSIGVDESDPYYIPKKINYDRYL